jgi:hypothetical protein
MAVGLLNPYRFAAADYLSTILADSPLFYGRFGEASGTVMTDSSGNGRNGVYSGGVALGQTGALVGDANTAVSPNGGEGTLTDAAWMEVSAATIEVWFKTSAVANGQMICRDTGGGANRVFQFRCDSDGRIRDDLHSISGASAGFNNNQWHHAALVLASTGSRLLVDGVVEAAVAGTSQPTGTTTNITVGVGGWGGERFTGVLDEFAYYGTALSDTQIIAHYNAGT